MPKKALFFYGETSGDAESAAGRETRGASAGRV